MDSLQLWGGHECTVNRVGDRYFDQTVRSGHEDRIGDLELFAELGVSALRYPVLWERVSPHAPDARDWRWSDARLSRMRALGMRPIAGLVHHGSGPRYTHLLDPGFAAGLADHARAVAERYPWIQDWTPVNEPLTTARFACLYGHWYPHRTDETAFWTALLNEIDGVRLSMQAIRAVNPAARLIQTEDLGHTYSTRAVAHQAEFDNHRRWMTWDLLAGRVTAGHPLWARLGACGLEDRLRAIADDPVPADVIGINHYLTSDRFLDHRCELYPPERCGGNAFIRFADVEAVRVTLPGPGGLEGALEEAWDRYGTALAVTESHNGCTREEQVRWVREAWATAQRLRGDGVEIEAVTAWALLGSFDWNSLLTREGGAYESGAFDVTGGAPRPTAVAHALRTLALGGEPHPAAAGPGWWRRDIRLEFRPVYPSLETPAPPRAMDLPQGGAPPVLIAGATGTLGRALARACGWRGLPYVLTGRRQMDLDDEGSIAAAIERFRPWAVINAAGWVRVDDAEAEREGCLAANAAGAARLAQACHEAGIPFLGFSSDLVFDGSAGRPYLEDDAPSPLNVYGESKAQAERLVLQPGRQALMVRTAAFFSPYDPWNFAEHVRHTLAGGGTLEAAQDLIVSPTYVPDLADACLDLLIDGERGLWHLANEGAVSWADFARMIADALDLDPEGVRGVEAATFGWPARRPARADLASRRGRLMPPLETAVARYAAAVREADFPGEVEARIEGAPPARARTRRRGGHTALPQTGPDAARHAQS